MRKIVCIFGFMLCGIFSYAIDIGGEVKNTLNLNIDNEVLSETSAKIDFKMKGDQFYSQITVKGSYTTEGEIYIDRAYTEIYNGKFTGSIGRQRISWGTGYLFNYADAFNELDPKDPKGEKKGVDSLKLRYDITDTARIESVGVTNYKSKFDYAARAAATLGSFDIMINYIRLTPEKINKAVELFPKAEITNEYIVLETKGEYEVGIWGAAVYKKNNMKNIPEQIKENYKSDEKIGVIGIDYTISFGEESEVALYILGEYSHNDTTKDKLAYEQMKLTVFKDLDVTEGLLFDTSKGGIASMSLVNYVINDYITATIGFNRYIDKQKSKYISAMGTNSDSELYFTLKSNF